jgi:6-phosphofructokinase 1
MRVIGVPKTIDNDLVGTDHTPGFASAAKYIATTMAEIIRDCAVYTTKAVTVVEIMGRDAGWLTASAGIAKAFGGEVADLIYLPERAFNKDEFFEDLREILNRKPNVVVAVSEGIRFADGTYVCEGFGIASTDVFGHKQLSGTGKALEVAIKNEFGCKVRSIELNLPQRCASHIASKTDIEESVCVGRAAVKAASEGITRQMMTVERVSTTPYKTEISHRDVSEIANKVKHVPDEFINERGNSVTDECAIYLLPLIQGEIDVKYENGIPKHIII